MDWSKKFQNFWLNYLARNRYIWDINRQLKSAVPKDVKFWVIGEI